MIKESAKAYLSFRLIEEFGKDIFKENELTAEFWTDLYIKCNDFFRLPDGGVDLDFFHSKDLYQWLVSEK